MTTLLLPDSGEVTLRDRVHAIEFEMKQREQVHCPVKHHFSPGVYARELFIPAGTLLTGKIHKYPQLNILSQGEIAVLTEDGIRRLQASFTIVSPAGTKRIAYALTDCVWTTIHHTFETDPDTIEHLVTAASEPEYIEFLNKARQVTGPHE
jgi:hypothetical protein